MSEKSDLKYSQIVQLDGYSPNVSYRDWIVNIINLLNEIKGVDNVLKPPSMSLTDITGIENNIKPNNFLNLSDASKCIEELLSFRTYTEDLLKNILEKIPELSESSQMSSIVNATKINVEKLTNIVNTNTEDIENVLNNISTVNDDMTSIKNRTTVLEKNISDNNEQISNINSSLEVHDNKLKLLEDAVDSIDLTPESMNFIVSGQNAKKIICSNTEPTNNDGEPNGTIYIVF